MTDVGKSKIVLIRRKAAFLKIVEEVTITFLQKQPKQKF
jgi:hypothetical protein